MPAENNKIKDCSRYDSLMAECDAVCARLDAMESLRCDAAWTDGLVAKTNMRTGEAAKGHLKLTSE